MTYEIVIGILILALIATLIAVVIENPAPDTAVEPQQLPEASMSAPVFVPPTPPVDYREVEPVHAPDVAANLEQPTPDVEPVDWSGIRDPEIEAAPVPKDDLAQVEPQQSVSIAESQQVDASVVNSPNDIPEIDNALLDATLEIPVAEQFVPSEFDENVSGEDAAAAEPSFENVPNDRPEFDYPVHDVSADVPVTEQFVPSEVDSTLSGEESAPDEDRSPESPEDPDRDAGPVRI